MSAEIPPTTPSRRAAGVTGGPVPTEEQEQVWLAQYLDALRLVWWHTPNGGHRDIRTARKLAAHGVKAGVPDVIIVSRPPRCPEARGVAIELKRRKGGVVSDFQESWLTALEEQGWKCTVARGWQEAAEWLERECGFGGELAQQAQRRRGGGGSGGHTGCGGGAA